MLCACGDSFLDEDPKNFLTIENVLVDSKGFETITTGLYAYVREEFETWSGMVAQTACPYEVLQTGLDICTSSSEDKTLANFTEYIYNPANTYIQNRWKWAYGVITNANIMINKAEDPSVRWDKEEDKLFYQAGARFFRTYAYRYLVYLYGDVPWVTQVEDNFRTDFERTPKAEVLANMIEDLEFAAKYLPENPDKVADGKLTKWVALHLLSELCNFSGDYKRAETAALEVINSSYFQLMDYRFGESKGEAGDPFSDLFKENNQNRKSGNLESLFVIQFAYKINGGGNSNTDWSRRAWVPGYFDIPGFVISKEYGGRGRGQIYPLSWWLDSYEDNDMRNSPCNIRREYYYNDPDSPLFGQKHEITEINIKKGHCYPTTTKFDYMPEDNETFNGNMKDKIRFRLAETYLLLAEAYINQNDLAKAAEAINKVRARAQATPVQASDVDMDYLLDERARELLGEEMRRFTLIRTAKLLERTRKLNPVSGPIIQDHHVLWPIPQNVMDANSGKVWENNPGWS